MRALKYVISVAVLFAGCAATYSGEEKILASWRGAEIESVYLRWGIPDKKVELSNGKTLHEWYATQTYVLPSTTTATVNIVGSTAYVNSSSTGGPISGNCRRLIVSDANGKVTEGSSQGNNCCVMAFAGYCAGLLNPAKKGS